MHTCVHSSTYIHTYIYIYIYIYIYVCVCIFVSECVRVHRDFTNTAFKQTVMGATQMSLYDDHCSLKNIYGGTTVFDLNSSLQSVRRPI